MESELSESTHYEEAACNNKNRGKLSECTTLSLINLEGQGESFVGSLHDSCVLCKCRLLERSHIDASYCHVQVSHWSCASAVCKSRINASDESLPCSICGLVKIHANRVVIIEPFLGKKSDVESLCLVPLTETVGNIVV